MPTYPGEKSLAVESLTTPPTWEPYLSPTKGETVCFVMRLTHTVRLNVVFYQPDGIWYSAVNVRTLRVAGWSKSQNEETAKRRAVELAVAFNNQLAVSLHWFVEPS